jgi:hypothetical protein
MTPRDVAQDVLIAALQQNRVVAAAGQLDVQGRRAVRDILIRVGKQAPLNYWEGACDLADGERL